MYINVVYLNMPICTYQVQFYFMCIHEASRKDKREHLSMSILAIARERVCLVFLACTDYFIAVIQFFIKLCIQFSTY